MVFAACRASGTWRGGCSTDTSDLMSLTRTGDSQAPWKSDLLRGMRRIALDGVRGVPGIGYVARRVFDGYLRSDVADSDRRLTGAVEVRPSARHAADRTGWCSRRAGQRVRGAAGVRRIPQI